MTILSAAIALTGATLGAGTAAAAPAMQCDPQGPYQISVYGGQIDCEQAYGIAAAYDTVNGDKHQQIGEFICYSASANVAPIVLQCVSGDIEFAVSTV